MIVHFRDAVSSSTLVQAALIGCVLIGYPEADSGAGTNIDRAPGNKLVI